MKTRIISSLIMIILLTAINSIPSANLSPSTVIWGSELQLTQDPLDIDPETGEILGVFVDFDGMPSITQTQDQKIWVVWYQDLTENFQIYYKIYSQTWYPPGEDDVQLTNNAYDDICPTIIQTADGKIWVAWSSNRTGVYDVYYKTSANNGQSWTTETQLTTDPRDDNDPALYRTSDGKIWLVWTRRLNATNDDVFYKTFDGTSWSPETQLTTDAQRDWLPTITQTSDGKVWVLWCSFRTKTYWQIYYKTYDGTSWSSEFPLTSDEKDNLDPTMFQDKDGTIWLFWMSKATQGGSANFDIYYKTSANNGQSWTSTIQFTTDTNEDLWPTALQARDNSTWVVWASTRNDNIDLYYRTSLLGDINNDGSIDITDLVFIARALATNPTWPHGTGWNQWNPACDLNLDNKVDVEDLFIAGKNYGRHN